MKKSKIKVAVSGGFDPVHIGHLRMFQKAKNRSNPRNSSGFKPFVDDYYQL